MQRWEMVRFLGPGGDGPPKEGVWIVQLVV